MVDVALRPVGLLPLHGGYSEGIFQQVMGYAYEVSVRLFRKQYPHLGSRSVGHLELQLGACSQFCISLAGSSIA